MKPYMLLALIIRKKSQTISNNLTKAHIRSFGKHDSISTNFHINTIYLALSCTSFGWPERLDVSCMPKWPQSKEKPTAIFTIVPCGRSEVDLYVFVISWPPSLFRWFCLCRPVMPASSAFERAKCHTAKEHEPPSEQSSPIKSKPYHPNLWSFCSWWMLVAWCSWRVGDVALSQTSFNIQWDAGLLQSELGWNGMAWTFTRKQ